VWNTPRQGNSDQDRGTSDPVHTDWRPGSTEHQQIGRDDGARAARTLLPGTIKANDMVEIQPIRVDVEREADGRWLAVVPELPGVMVYGVTEAEAIRRVKAIALQVLADMIESGEEVPAPLMVLFAA
jgi:predicted RNase H-like HicB family nuclease